MTRIRSIKPAFFRSLSIAELDVTAKLTFIGLWTYVDDKGRGVDNALLIKAEVWPLDDKHTTKKVEDDLKALEKHDHICRYQAAGARYLHVVKWKVHQVINRPHPSQHPPCPVHDESRNGHGPPANTGTDHVPLTEDSVNDHEPLTPVAGTEVEVEVEVEKDPPQPPPSQPPGTSRPQPGEKRDLSIEKRPTEPTEPTEPADPIRDRLEAVCTARNRKLVRSEAGRMLEWARRYVADQVIDEAIGWAGQLAEPPVFPRAVAKMIRTRAAENEIQIPEFQPLESVAS